MRLIAIFIAGFHSELPMAGVQLCDTAKQAS
jgi:hypothetical protein